MATIGPFIRCRYCPWKTSRWLHDNYTPGWEKRIRRHVIEHHENELFILYGVSSRDMLMAKLDVQDPLAGGYCEEINRVNVDPW